MKALNLILAALLMISASVALAGGPPYRGGPDQHPYPHYYQYEHPRHRLAHWYANESMRQNEGARSMVCGFAGQRWALDREMHYRWALRANPNRVYREIEERDRHLARCRSNKLREFRPPPDSNHP